MDWHGNVRQASRSRTAIMRSLISFKAYERGYTLRTFVAHIARVRQKLNRIRVVYPGGHPYKKDRGARRNF